MTIRCLIRSLPPGGPLVPALDDGHRNRRYLLYRDRHAPGAGRLTAFGIFWFFMTLSVESSIIPIADVIFEHRLYLPSVGFFIAITSALFWAAERLWRDGRTQCGRSWFS